MKKQPYRHPREMKEEKRVPVSARIKTSSRVTLEKAAKAQGISLALLLANVIDDYSAWLVKRR